MSWTGRLFLGDGWLVYAGPIGTTTSHAHHAFQLVRSLDAPVVLRGRDGDAASCDAAVIAPDVEHAEEQGARETVLVYVDPDTVDGRRLRRVVASAPRAEDWRAAGEPLRALAMHGLPQTFEAAHAHVDASIRGVVGEEGRTLALHPALMRARTWLAAHLDEDDVSLDRVAQEVGISRDRLSHLFGEQLGLGLRPFVLWLRLQRAAQELARGETMTRAAVAAGFADGAHMTRTFRRMFGVAPSDVVGVAEWVPATPPVTE